MKKIFVLFTLLAMSLSACAVPGALAITPTTTPVPSQAETQPPQAVIAPLATATATVQPIGQPTGTPDAPPTPNSGGGFPPAVLAARKDLAQLLSLQAESLVPTSIVSRDWRDSCLGAARAGEMCLQVITPGFEITFVVGVAQYVYHTNLEGTSLRRVDRPAPATSGETTRVTLKWQNAACDMFFVSTQAAFYGRCDANDWPAVLGPKSSMVDQALEWVQKFAPFKAETVAGTVEFNGLGQTVATPAEQRMMAEWAKRQFDVTQAGRGSANLGLAFSYTRSGGIAGFCDTVSVYRDGLTLVEDCKGTLATLYLTALQLETFYGWLDGLKRFEYKSSDPAIADAMSINLVFEGQGQKNTDEATTRAILDFSANLVTQGRFSQQLGDEFFAAKDSLLQFFTALNSGDYILGAKLYGGDTSQLQTWNPDIQDDLPKWLERACARNGLQCLLPRSVTYRGQDSRGGYQFLVEFNNDDGALFRQGDTSVFLFSVVKPGENWQVMELPPYAP